MDAIADKVKRRLSLHGNRCARMVGQDEDRRMVRRVLAPPTFPILIRPGSAEWPEHIATKNPRTDVLKSPRSEVVVQPGGTATAAEQLPKSASTPQPFVKL